MLFVTYTHVIILNQFVVLAKFVNMFSYAIMACFRCKPRGRGNVSKHSDHVR